ncbi:MAG: phenylalanine--tRNA ligase beta subunit-related protein [Candidatus Microsaccharimonas sp.]
MSEITFKIDKTIFLKHPGFRRVIIIAEGIQNTGNLTAEIDQQIQAIKAVNPEDPRLVSWREAFLAEGIKLRDFRPSIDALVRRIQADKPFGSINPIVDVGTIVSLKYLLPAGAHPILADSQDISLERADGTEVDVTLDGKTEQVQAGEIVLKDNGRLAARRWVWRQTPLSRIDNNTTGLFLNIDALAVASDTELNEAIGFAENLIKETFGVATQTIILSAKNPTQEI